MKYLVGFVVFGALITVSCARPPESHNTVAVYDEPYKDDEYLGLDSDPRLFRWVTR